MQQQEQDTAANNAYIFNQYYIELLKVCKNNAKSAKDRPGSRGKMARDVLRAIKKHYSSFDKMSPEHMAFFKAEVGEAADRFLVEGGELEAVISGEWFRDITYEQVKAFGKDLLQNWTILGLLIREGVEGTKVVEVSRKMADAAEFEAALEAAFGGAEPAGLVGTDTNTIAKAALTRLRASYVAEAKNGSNANGSNANGSKTASPIPGLDGIEDTSLGKLAKEIMEDPEVQLLHASLKTAMDGAGGDGGPENIMKMFGNGESGNDIAKLMGTVSQKMIQKLMSGEIKQETLLQDAMSFAGKLGGGMPGGLDLSSIGNMLGGLAGGAGGMGGGGAGGGFDFSSMLKAFGGGGGGGSGGGSAKKAERAARAAAARTGTARGGAMRAAERGRRKLAERTAGNEAAGKEKM